MFTIYYYYSLLTIYYYMRDHFLLFKAYYYSQFIAIAVYYLLLLCAYDAYKHSQMHMSRHTRIYMCKGQYRYRDTYVNTHIRRHRSVHAHTAIHMHVYIIRAWYVRDDPSAPLKG